MKEWSRAALGKRDVAQTEGMSVACGTFACFSLRKTTQGTVRGNQRYEVLGGVIDRLDHRPEMRHSGSENATGFDTVEHQKQQEAMSLEHYFDMIMILM